MDYRRFVKSKQIFEAIQQQNNEYAEILEPEDLTVRPNYPSRPLNQIIDLILKPFFNSHERLGQC